MGRWWLLGCGLVWCWFVAGCGGGTPAETVTVSFTALPMRLADVAYIQPLGNLNPPGHTFPTDHIYLYLADRSQVSPVYAPADATITNIAYRQESGDDYGLDFERQGTVGWYLGHLSSLDPAILAAAGPLALGNNPVRVTVRAGQPLGTTGGRPDYLWALDFGAYDTSAPLTGFIHPQRYPERTRCCRSPLTLYAEPLRGQLYGLVNRTGPDRDGRIDFDQPGRLVGNWFGQGAGIGDWSRHLAFVYDPAQPAEVRIVLGGELGTAGVFAIPDTAPRPADVTAGTGRLVYPLLQGGAPVHQLAVQLLSGETLRVELLPAEAPADTPFGAGARLYGR